MRVPVVGFDRRLELAWLERAASLVLLGITPDDARRLLGSQLEESDDGGGMDGRRKSLLLLTRIWVEPRDDLRALRDEGLTYIRRLPADEHLPIHWGMTMAAYPFFGQVADAAGRLLALQGTAGAAQVQRRMQELLGDRQFVTRPTRHVLRTMVTWRTLRDTETKGMYAACPRVPVDDELAPWLLEALMRARQKRAVHFRSLLGDPALFPFALPPVQASQMAARNGLDLFRQGLDDDVTSLPSE